MMKGIVLALGLVSVVCGSFSMSADAPARSGARDESLSPSCKGKPAKVDDAGFVVIGRIEQWVTAKGDSCANPVLFFISGGPGNPLSGISDSVYGAGQRDFIVVQWDQRDRA